MWFRDAGMEFQRLILGNIAGMQWTLSFGVSYNIASCINAVSGIIVTQNRSF